MKDGTRQLSATDLIRNPELRLYDPNNSHTSWTDSYGAAFEADSTVLNYINSLEYENPPIEGYNPVAAGDVPQDMSYHLNEYLGSKSPGQSEQITGRLRYEQQRTMTAGENMSANVIGSLSGTLFGSPEYLPLMFVPISGWGRAAIGVGRAAKTFGALRHAKAAAKLGGLAAGEEVIHEAVLHQSTLTRTLNESYMNVGVAGLFGTTIGGVGSAIFRGRYLDAVTDQMNDVVNGAGVKRADDYLKSNESMVVNADNSVVLTTDVGSKASRKTFNTVIDAEVYLKKRAGEEPLSAGAAAVSRGSDEDIVKSPWAWERKWRNSEIMRRSPLRSANISLERGLLNSRSETVQKGVNDIWGHDKPTGATDVGIARMPALTRRVERTIGRRNHETRKPFFDEFWKWSGVDATARFKNFKATVQPSQRKLLAQYNREVSYALRNDNKAADGNPNIEAAARGIMKPVLETTTEAVEEGMYGYRKVPIKDQDGEIVVENGKVLMRDEPINPIGDVKYGNSWWARGWNAPKLREHIAVVQEEMRANFKAERLDIAAVNEKAIAADKVVRKNEKKVELRKELTGIKNKNNSIIKRASKWLDERKDVKKLTKTQTEGIGARKAKISEANKKIKNASKRIDKNIAKLDGEINELNNVIDEIGSSKWIDRQINEEDLFSANPTWKNDIEGDVQKTFKNMVYGKVDGRVYGDESSKANSFKERMVPIHDDFAAPLGLLDDDVLTVARNYYESTIRPTMMKADQGDPELEGFLDSIADNYGNMASDAGMRGDTKLQNSLLRESGDMIKMNQVARNRYYHRSLVPKDPKSVSANISRILRDFNVTIRMGGVVPTSLSDIGRYNMAKIYAPEIGRFGTTVRDGIKAKKYNDGTMRDYGVAHETSDNVRAARMMDIDDPNPADWAITRMADRFAYTLMRSTGLSEYTDFGKLTVANIFQNELWRVAKRWDELTPKTKATLAKQGFDENLANEMKKEFKRGTIKYIDNNQKVVTTNYADWQNQAMADRFADVLFKESERILGSPNELTMPIWADGEMAKLITQFKSFSLAAHQQVTAPMGDRMKRGDILAYQTIATALMMGVITEVIKAAIAGEDAMERLDNYTPSDWVYAALDRSAMMPLLLMGFNGIDMLSANKITKLLGKTQRGSPSRHGWERGLGPSPSLVTDLWDISSAIASGEVSERDARTIRRLLPFNNLVWISRALDEAESYAASKLPSGKKSGKKRTYR